jgi:hypothetical protein
VIEGQLLNDFFYQDKSGLGWQTETDNGKMGQVSFVRISYAHVNKTLTKPRAFLNIA